MFGSDRGDIGSTVVFAIAVALFASLVLIFVAGISAQNAYRIAAGEDRAERYDSCRQAGESSLIPFLFDACSPTEPDPEQTTKIAEYDLAAQNRMADWTAIVAVISIFGLLTSIFGVLLVKRTFDKTGEALNAAREANEISRSDSRAWVGFDSIEISGGRVDENHAHVTVKVVLKNYGLRPAQSVGFHAALYASHKAIQAHRTEMGTKVAAGFEPVFPSGAKPYERLASVLRSDVEAEIAANQAFGVPVADSYSPPICLLILARYGTEGERVHETGMVYWLSADTGKWWRNIGNHNVDVGPIGSIDSWAT